MASAACTDLPRLRSQQWLVPVAEHAHHYTPIRSYAGRVIGYMCGCDYVADLEHHRRTLAKFKVRLERIRRRSTFTTRRCATCRKDMTISLAQRDRGMRYCGKPCRDTAYRLRRKKGRR